MKTPMDAFAAKCRLDLLEMIQTAGSGHPGGALSAVDALIALYSTFPEDRLIVSCGHISAAVYSVLGNFSFFDVKDAIAGFRHEGSVFEGHPGCAVPGVEWCSGALGQGLSVAAGFAAGEKLANSTRHVWVLMGDGEQNKGQLQEARIAAVKFGLSNLTAMIDVNGLQASGTTGEIFPANLEEIYRSAGWEVISADGHDIPGLQKTMTRCRSMEKPCVILLQTIMGKGVPEIENHFEYHGKLLDKALWQTVKKRLENASSGERYLPPAPPRQKENQLPPLKMPEFKEYDAVCDCRSAFGNTIEAIVRENPERTAAVDCDLEASVKLQKYHKTAPSRFFECGIAEHNAASFAAGLSRLEPATFWADFGVFGMNEVLGCLRMADFNHTSLKVVCTHCGADVGEDGKTHQAVDYLALARTLPDFKLLAPADANQCEHMVRYAAQQPGNFFLVMGRSPVPVLKDQNGKALFGRNYRFTGEPSADILRSTPEDRATIITYGNMSWRAVKLVDDLAAENIPVRVISLGTPLNPSEEALRSAAETGLVAVWEDHRQENGLGAQLAAWFFEHGISCKFKRFGLTKYGISASPEAQYRNQQIAPENVRDSLVNLLK